LELGWKLTSINLFAMGYPHEQPIMEDARSSSDEATRYYVDGDDKLHVPKRQLKSIAHLNHYSEPID